MPPFRVGKPRARLVRTADETLAAGAQVITWQQAVFDDVAGWDGASSYVLDRPGLWLVGLQVQRRPVAVSSQVTARINVNGVTAQSLIGVASSAVQTVATTALLELAEGDVVQASTTLHTTLPADVGFSQSVLWITRVGPERWTG